MEGRNWSMYGLAIDVTELWPQKTCGPQYIYYIAVCVKKYISYGISGSRNLSVEYTYSHMVW